MTFDLPPVVASKARVAGLQAWVDDLPALVDALAEEWQLSVGRTMADGTEALVLEVEIADGEAAVLKVVVPRLGAARDETAVLRLAGGEGCVRLLRADEARSALLLERLGPSMYELGLPFEERLPLLCDAARAVWRAVPDVGLTTGADKARSLAEGIVRRWEVLDRPCTEAAIEHALGCAGRREAAHDDDRAMLLHGDVHQWNALRSGDGFKLIDPDGLVAEPEYDLGILMREDPVELLAGEPWDRARWLAARTGLDAVAIWEWGVVERVSTGLLAVEIGLRPAGDEMLEAADVIAGRHQKG